MKNLNRIFELIHFYLTIRKKWNRLKNYVEAYQPIGHIGTIQRMMDTSYKPQE